jgi:hypothetical protein
MSIAQYVCNSTVSGISLSTGTATGAGAGGNGGSPNGHAGEGGVSIGYTTQCNF